MASTSTNSVITSSIDVSSMVNQLMAVESQPLILINNKVSKVNANLSAYGQLKSALTAFQNTASNLSTSNKFNIQTAVSSNDAVLTATSDGTSSLGNYQLNVSQLAQAQKLKTDVLTLSYPVTGAVTIDGTTISINEAGSLSAVRDAINAGNTLMTASIVNNGTSDLLVFTSSLSGSANARSISFSGGLSGITTSTLVAPQNAILKLDGDGTAGSGIEITSASNRVTGVLPGVTLNLTGVSASVSANTSLSVSTDETAIKKSVTNFVDAYNTLKTTVANLTKYDSTGKNNGALFGDTTLRGIMNSMQSVFSESISSNTNLKYLSDVGVTLQKSGQLAVDDTKLTSAISNNFSEFASLFADTGNTPKGYAAQLSTKLDSILNTTDGLLSVKTEGLSSTITSLTAQTEAWNLKLESIRKRYTTQFSSLDQLLTNLTNKNTFLTQQLDALAKQTGRN
jgi:flagellar hook-associated protein 2